MQILINFFKFRINLEKEKMIDLNKFLLSPINEEIKIKLQRILLTIIKFDEAYEFLEPVNYVKYNIPDYPKVIKYPRDLGSIR